MNKKDVKDSEEEYYIEQQSLPCRMLWDGRVKTKDLRGGLCTMKTNQIAGKVLIKPFKPINTIITILV